MAEQAAKVAFVGLGVMGFPMAGHWAQAGLEVCVYNRNGARAEAWLERFPGRAAPTPREAAAGAEVVALCVGTTTTFAAWPTALRGSWRGWRRAPS